MLFFNLRIRELDYNIPVDVKADELLKEIDKVNLLLLLLLLLLLIVNSMIIIVIICIIIINIIDIAYYQYYYYIILFYHFITSDWRNSIDYKKSYYQATELTPLIK